MKPKVRFIFSLNTFSLKIFLAISIILFLCLTCSQYQSDKEELVETLNPYEYIGKMHNEGLFKILSENKILNQMRSKKAKMRSSEYDQDIKEQILEESLEYTTESVEDIDPVISRYYLSEMQKELYIDDQVEINEDLEYIQYYLNNDYYINCLQILKNVCADKEDENVIQKVSDFKNEIQLIEKELISSKTIQEDEKIILLMGLSVIKNSFEFWANNQDLLLGDSSTRSGAPNWLKRFYRKLEEVVQDDAVGAIGGAAWTIMSGATAGSLVFGPGGAVTTIAAGAVGGAITGSLLGQAFAEESVSEEDFFEEE